MSFSKKRALAKKRNQTGFLCDESLGMRRIGYFGKGSPQVNQMQHRDLWQRVQGDARGA